ncbi:MAG: hypothetical protein KC503_35190 [Myxococcales bacterium]|nr:hypothetical protein [Myxococcales bacterium]
MPTRPQSRPLPRALASLLPLLLLLLLASACTRDAARIAIEVDSSGCDPCIDSAQLSVGRDGCLLTKYDAATTSGERSLAAGSVRAGDMLTLALVMHCPNQTCANCVASAEVTARDGLVVTLTGKKPTGCVERGALPPVEGLSLCNTPDGALPDTTPPRDSTRDSTRDRGPQDLDSGGGGKSTCAQVRECGFACTDQTCLTACLLAACPSSAVIATQLVTCVGLRCPSCLQDFSTCASCIELKCKNENDACTNATCP